jgi:bifunctional lysine-specific demethylase and histidyl-hydroxylase NO66
MDFAELIAPLAPEHFLAEHWGRKPVHVPAPTGSGRAGVIGWARLNQLLGIRSHWGPEHIKLLLNSAPVAPDFYMDEVQTHAGPRQLADPAKVEMFLAMGASLVADAVEQVAPEVRALTDSLAQRFAARVEANLYCSFQGVQAFASHCDLHEVFAIHCVGEKRWRIYANRAENPLEHITGDDAQARIDAAKGPVLMDVTLRPGDLLYIPRGYFHDALASSAESLHLTLGVTPHSGKLLFELLQEMAVREPAFRAYLADAREQEGAALAGQLAALGARLSELAGSRAMQEEIAIRQRRLAAPHRGLALPARPALDFHARTDRPAAVAWLEAGAVLRAGGGDQPLGPIADAAEYVLSRPAVSAQELRARFAHHPDAELAALLALLTRLGLVRPYRPGL